MLAATRTGLFIWDSLLRQKERVSAMFDRAVPSKNIVPYIPKLVAI